MRLQTFITGMFAVQLANDPADPTKVDYTVFQKTLTFFYFTVVSTNINRFL